MQVVQLALLSFVLGTGVAAGQASDRTDVRMSRASAKERRYAQRIGAAFGARSDQVAIARYAFDWNPEAALAQADAALDQLGGELQGRPKPQRVRGVIARVAGVLVQRLRFADADAALQFAGVATAASPPGAISLTEARGNQVVVLAGRALEDPERAARLLAAAWEVLAVRGERALLQVASAEANATRTVERGPAYEVASAVYAALGERRERFDDPWRSSRGQLRAPGVVFAEDGEVTITNPQLSTSILKPGADGFLIVTATGADAEPGARAIRAQLEAIEAASERLAGGERPARARAAAAAAGEEPGRRGRAAAGRLATTR